MERRNEISELHISIVHSHIESLNLYYTSDVDAKGTAIFSFKIMPKLKLLHQ